MACDNSPFFTRVKASASEILYSPFYSLWGGPPLSASQQECIADDAAASLGPAATQAEKDTVKAQTLADIQNGNGVTNTPSYCDAFQKAFQVSCRQAIFTILAGILVLVIVSAFAEGLGRGVGEKV